MTWSPSVIVNSYENIASRIDALRDNFPDVYSSVTSNVLEVDDGYGRPRDFDSSYVNYFTNNRIVLSKGDIEDIAERFEQVVLSGSFDKHKHEFAYLIGMLECRFANASALPPFNIVSLGWDCLSRSIPTKWGLKRSRLLGEQTMPFDLSNHPLPGLTEILENRFADYLSTTRLSFDPQRNHPVDNGRGILWNHEVGSEWADNNFSKFIDRYERRIQNFARQINDGKPTVFVLYNHLPLDRETISLVARVANALPQLGKGRVAICFICSAIDDPNKTAPDHLNLADDVKIPVMYFPIPIPYNWYLWFDHRHFTLPLGMDFEAKIVQSVCDTAKLLL